MSRESLTTQRNQKKSELCATNAKLDTIEEKLFQVRQGKSSIAILKEDASTINGVLNQLEYADSNYWFGNKQTVFEGTYYEQSLDYAKQYYNSLDELADELIDAERKLDNKKEQYCFIIGELNNAISWLWGEIQKLTN